MAELCSSIWLTVLDKGIFALLLGAAGFWFNAILQKRAARDQLLHAISSDRVAAYKSLWKLSEPTRFSVSEPLSDDDRSSLRNRMTEWYYAEGNALFLSHAASAQFFAVRRALEENSPNVKPIFSALRSQLKYDCGIYTERERTTLF